MKAFLKRFKRTLLASSLFLSVCFCPNPSLALTVEEVPNPRQVNGGWVSDRAEILAPTTEAQLNQMISELENKTSVEIAVVTLSETAPTSPKKFTTELFNYWRIGKVGQDNGVLFLIAVKERRVEIETGYGIEPMLPNPRVGRIIDTQILPRFRQGDFDRGTLAGTKAIIAILAEANVEDSHDAPELIGNSDLLLPVCLILGGTVLIAIYLEIFGVDANSEVGGVYGGGGGDGACSGGGFGGGASGGGGAGGGW